MTAHLLALAVPAVAAPAEFPTPTPDDPRCGGFGWVFGEPMPRIPVAWPLVEDLTANGELAKPASDLAATLAADLDLSGVFDVNAEGLAPSTSLPLWTSEAAFDYIGWREAGVYLVVAAKLSRAAGGLRVRLDAYLTEEGDRLRIGGSEAVLPADGLERLANRWVNSLLQCITGLPGAFGTRIAYARRTAVGKPKEIFWVEFGSKEQVQVSRDGVVAMLPAWAPGGAVAWTGYRRGTPEVYLAPCEGCKLRDPGGGRGGILSDRPGQNSGIAFSPDGKIAALTLAPEGNPDIWLIDARTGAEKARLTSASGIDTSPAWSPDGRTLAFVSDRNGGPQIWLMDADGQNPRPLPLPGSYNTSPDWSPDGGEIAYQSRGDNQRFSIWAYNLDTGSTRRLSGGAWDDEEPAYSPDGRLIAFTSTRGKTKQLFVMTREGSFARALFKDGGEYFTPAWERQFNAIAIKRKNGR